MMSHKALYFHDWNKSCRARDVNLHGGGLDPMLVISQMSAGWRICEMEHCAVVRVVKAVLNDGRS